MKESPLRMELSIAMPLTASGCSVKQMIQELVDQRGSQKVSA